MRIEVSQFYSVDDSSYLRLFGRWDTFAIKKILIDLEAHPPRFLVLDPTEALVPDDTLQSLETSSEERKNVINRFINLLVDNPKMLYIVINRNDNPGLKTAMPAYEAKGVGDRYIFVRSESDVLSLIRKHRNADS